MTKTQIDPLIRYLRTVVASETTATLTDSQLLGRFAADRDEGAFATLVRRHGAMVHGVCRRVLGDWHAAQDALQATFLVLARKAGSLRRPELLAQWLFGVAYRTAVKARAEISRRRTHERRAGVREAIAAADEHLWRDLRSVLDEEVNRLPTRYREPIVLCYLQGRTNTEAARALGCSRGTVATRLARARERLRRGLTRRGVAPTAVLAAAALAGQAQGSPLSAALAASIARAGVLFAARRVSAAGVVSPRVAFLAQGVTRAMLMKKLKVAVSVLFLLGVLVAGAGVAADQAGSPGPAAAQGPREEGPRPVDAGGERAPPTTTGRETAPGAEVTHRTANFAVTAHTQKIADRVGRALEQHRKALALRWLGKELPAWPEPCPVRVKVMDGRPAHYTTFAFRPPNTVLRQEMGLEAPLDKLLADLVPHEVTHLILAHWSGRPLPRWADEGAAQLAESAASRARPEAALAKVLAQGRRLPLRQLLPMTNFPADVQALYAQGYALTEFLVRTQGRPKFLAFVAQGQRDGWDQAARDQYGYRNVEELERAWLAGVERRQAQPPVASAAPDQDRRAAEIPRPGKDRSPPDRQGPGGDRASPKGQLPAGPTPVQALVELDGRGGLEVWRVVNFVEPKMVAEEGGRPVTTYQMASAMMAMRYPLDAVRAFDTKGKAVAPKHLARLLKGETPVLISPDGRPLDPLHLRLVKEGTLVFVLPVPAPAVPPVAPPAQPAPAVPPSVEQGGPEEIIPPPRR